MVLEETVCLGQLSAFVGEMACKEKVVTGLDHPGKAHEQERVHRQGSSHLARDQFGVLLEVSNSGQRQTPVGDYEALQKIEINHFRTTASPVYRKLNDCRLQEHIPGPQKCYG